MYDLRLFEITHNNGLIFRPESYIWKHHYRIWGYALVEGLQHFLLSIDGIRNYCDLILLCQNLERFKKGDTNSWGTMHSNLLIDKRQYFLNQGLTFFIIKNWSINTYIHKYVHIMLIPYVMILILCKYSSYHIYTFVYIYLFL